MNIYRGVIFLEEIKEASLFCAVQFKALMCKHLAVARALCDDTEVFRLCISYCVALVCFRASLDCVSDESVAQAKEHVAR